MSRETREQMEARHAREQRADNRKLAAAVGLAVLVLAVGIVCLGIVHGWAEAAAAFGVALWVAVVAVVATLLLAR